MLLSRTFGVLDFDHPFGESAAGDKAGLDESDAGTPRHGLQRSHAPRQRGGRSAGNATAESAQLPPGNAASTPVEDVDDAVAEPTPNSFAAAPVARAPFRPTRRQHEIQLDETLDRRRRKRVSVLSLMTAEEEESRLSPNHVDHEVGADERVVERNALNEDDGPNEKDGRAAGRTDGREEGRMARLISCPKWVLREYRVTTN